MKFQPQTFSNSSTQHSYALRERRPEQLEPGYYLNLHSYGIQSQTHTPHSFMDKYAYRINGDDGYMALAFQAPSAKQILHQCLENEYSINFTKNEVLEELPDYTGHPTTLSRGLCVRDKKQIYVKISDDFDKKDICRTLIHEATHAGQNEVTPYSNEAESQFIVRFMKNRYEDEVSARKAEWQFMKEIGCHQEFSLDGEKFNSDNDAWIGIATHEKILQLQNRMRLTSEARYIFSQGNTSPMQFIHGKSQILNP